MIAYRRRSSKKLYRLSCLVESGQVENVRSQLAIDYYKMKKNAKLSDQLKSEQMKNIIVK